jgi:transcriptional regulator with XRE-family HTH domain
VLTGPSLSSKKSVISVRFSKALREVRIAQKISQEKLALLAEVDRSYVGRIVRGDNNVAIVTLARLASALDITVAKLLQKAGLQKP